VPLLTDVAEKQGPTVLCTDSIAHMAKYLHAHPEGVTPRMTPLGSAQPDNMSFFKDVSRKCEQYVHVTGSK